MSANNRNLSASAHIDIERSNALCGKMREKLEIIAELPPIGSVVELYETVYRKRHVVRKGEKIRKYMIPITGGTAANGEVRKFVVDKYTRGIDSPLDPANHIVLKYYEPLSDAVEFHTTIPARQISIGVIKVVMVGEEL